MTFANSFLIYTNHFNRRKIFTGTSCLGISLNHLPQFFIIDSQQLTYLMNWHDSYQLKNQGFKKECKASSMTFPWSLNLSYFAIPDINPGNPGMKIALVLKKIKMSPRLLGRVIRFKMAFNS